MLALNGSGTLPILIHLSFIIIWCRKFDLYYMMIFKDWVFKQYKLLLLLKYVPISVIPEDRSQYKPLYGTSRLLCHYVNIYCFWYSNIRLLDAPANWGPSIAHPKICIKIPTWPTKKHFEIVIVSIIHCFRAATSDYLSDIQVRRDKILQRARAGCAERVRPTA